MTTVNYPSPVTVNGYSCKNCTDVDLAKQHIDPAHPKDGPYGTQAKDHAPSSFDPATGIAARADTPAVSFGGALTASAATSAAASSQPTALQTGQRLNLFA